MEETDGHSVLDNDANLPDVMSGGLLPARVGEEPKIEVLGIPDEDPQDGILVLRFNGELRDPPDVFVARLGKLTEARVEMAMGMIFHQIMVARTKGAQDANRLMFSKKVSEADLKNLLGDE